MPTGDWDDDDEFVTRVDRARHTSELRLGEQKLLDDLYEASQEGAPLHEEIASLQEELPVAETAADLMELLTTEAEIILDLVGKAFPDVESMPRIDEVERIGEGKFRVTFALRGSSDPTRVLVDGLGRFLGRA